MGKFKFLIGILAIILGVCAIVFVLTHESALVTHPKGIIAQNQLTLIQTIILLMLIVTVPAMVLFYLFAWIYRSKNSKTVHEPEKNLSAWGELILWIIPTLVVMPMIVITWYAAHELDPYQPIKSDVKPLKIQVVALDWKWLFIYPEQGIAALNFVQFPAQVPIHFELVADGSPMNSFWIAQLSGQIYAMTGMITQLHLMADEPGEYAGRAAEINGAGYADMTFVAKSTTQKEFEAWVAKVKASKEKLNHAVYSDLVKPSTNLPVTLYSSVEKDLFSYIAMKYSE